MGNRLSCLDCLTRPISRIRGVHNARVYGYGHGETYHFKEEPLGFPPSLLPPRVPVFMEVHIGDKLGPQGRYTVLRKLGYGAGSTVWLAEDQQSLPSKYVAIKILIRQATEHINSGLALELPVRQRIAQAQNIRKGGDKCIPLYDSFVCKTARNDTGPHHCFVTEVLGTDLDLYRHIYSRNGALPIPLLKHVLRDLLQALDYIHGCNVAHTNLRFTSIMVASPFSEEELATELCEEPTEYYTTYSILDRDVIAITSQPLNSMYLPVDKLHFKLGGFRHAQMIDQKTDKIDCESMALRAPETIVGTEWNCMVDIWAVGCLTFELLTGVSLFNPEDNPAFGTSAHDDDLHLLRIIQLRGEPFPPDVLAMARKRKKFFKADGTLIHAKTKILPSGLVDCIRKYKTVEDPDEVKAAAAFMDRCLQIRPEDRASAKELLQDSWITI